MTKKRRSRAGQFEPSAKVFDFRDEIRRSKRRRWLTTGKMIVAGLVGGVLLGLGSLVAPSAYETLRASMGSSSASPQFHVCGLSRSTCVVDGDTFWLDGTKIRIADIDTPEISSPRCDWEYDKGIEARDRLVVLLNEGPFDLHSIGARDEDQYGRKLRVVTRGGSSLGDQLVSEGLARTWTGRREPWC